MKAKLLLVFITLCCVYACNRDAEKRPVTETSSSPQDEFANIVMNAGENDTEKSVKAMPDSVVSIDDPASYIDPCAGALSVVYQKISVRTDKEYLEKLQYLYESTSQQELNNRRGSSLGITVPDYGTLNWGSNKAKVQKLYNKYRTQVNYSLAYTELMELNETYSRSEDVQHALNAWNTCIKDTYKVPYLSYVSNDDSSVVASFEMNPNQFRGPDDKVKVTDIVYSDNLRLLSSNFKKGGKIKYSGTYNLMFKRTSNAKAFVRVDLEEGKIVPVEIPKIIDSPVIVAETVKETYQYNVDINVSANWMKFTAPNGSVQTITFPDQSRNPYKLSFNVKTILKNPDAKVEDYFYSPIKGGLGDFRKRGVKIESNGNLSLDCYLVTGAKRMTGKFTVLYSTTKLVCKANCPEEQ